MFPALAVNTPFARASSSTTPPLVRVETGAVVIGIDRHHLDSWRIEIAAYIGRHHAEDSTSTGQTQEAPQWLLGVAAPQRCEGVLDDLDALVHR